MRQSRRCISEHNGYALEAAVLNEEVARHATARVVPIDRDRSLDASSGELALVVGDAFDRAPSSVPPEREYVVRFLPPDGTEIGRPPKPRDAGSVVAFGWSHSAEPRTACRPAKVEGLAALAGARDWQQELG